MFVFYAFLLVDRIRRDKLNDDQDIDDLDDVDDEGDDVDEDKQNYDAIDNGTCDLMKPLYFGRICCIT